MEDQSYKLLTEMFVICVYSTVLMFDVFVVYL